jgi:hypothetical protein
MSNAFDELNKAAFESFDPENSFDPQSDMFDEYGRPKMGMVPHPQYQQRPAGTGIQRSPARDHRNGKTPDAQFDILITNIGTLPINMELFNAQNTIEQFLNLTTNPTVHPVGAARLFNSGVGTSEFQEYVGYVVTQAIGRPALPNEDSCFFDENGNLIYNVFDPATSASCLVTVSCKQIPYRSLVKYSERGSFRINKMRMKFSDSAQINNDIQWKEKTFLGSTKTNTVSVSSYFRPDQFQSLLVDVPVPIRIDAEKGLFYTINAGNTVLINMFVSEYTRSAI